MLASDLLTLVSLAAMGCGFVVVGRSVAAFLGVAAFVVVAHFGVGAALGLLPHTTPERVLLAAGLVLCAFGALVVRIFLLRSISLKVLMNPDDDVEADLVAGIGRRPAEMQRHRLAVERDGALHLTPFGRLIAFLSGLLP